MPATRRHSRLTLATMFAVASVPCAWILENFGGERSGATALLTYLPQHGFALLPLLLGLLALRKRLPALACLNLMTLLLCAKWLLGFNLPFRALVPRKAAPTTRILTYNVFLGRSGVEKLARVIEKENPNIVCLQESARSNRARDQTFRQNLQTRFPTWNFASAGDATTFSRFALAARREWPLRGTRRILETTWNTPHGKIRVLNVHVATFYPGRKPARGRIGRARQIVREAQPSAQARLDQIAPIFHAVESGNSRLPLVVAGDFNTPPRGLFYRALTSKLNDSWTQSGMGTGHTFPSRLPLLRIDYIFSRRVKSKRAFVPDSRASDHLPLVVDVKF